MSLITDGTTMEQDAALMMVADRGLQVSRLCMNAMHGQGIDPIEANTLLFEGIAALHVAFPTDVDDHTLRMIMIRTGLAASFTPPPANDRDAGGDAA